MTLSEIVNDPSTKWDRMPPADERSIGNLLANCKLDLPADYLSFLRLSNGGEGELPAEPRWFQIWPAEESLKANNDYNVQEFVPGFFGFGSGGGGELLAFDTRTAQPWKVYMIPFAPMQEEYAIEIAGSFIAFISAVGRS
jgi:hypothetical protein